nr:MAG TPA: Protein of unknown function (DUF2500) [Caudoviricetes sp.]
MFKKIFSKNLPVWQILTIVAIFSIIFVLGTVLICEVGEEEKTVVTLVDKKVDRGLVRVGAAAVRVKKYIYVMDDEGYKFEKVVTKRDFGWFEKGDKIVVMRKKITNRLNGEVVGIKYRFFEE